MMKDEYVIVLDFLARGKPGDRKAEPVAQVLGEKFFSLLEIAIKPNVAVKTRDRIYIGDQSREQVEYIRGRISYADLTSYAKTELEGVLSDVVTKEEKRFVEFFNKAGPITTRLHSLELLPGIGKKHMWDVINARKKKPFESFADLQQRVEMLPDPKRILIRRMIDEFEEKDRYHLIVGSGIF